MSTEIAERNGTGFDGGDLVSRGHAMQQVRTTHTTAVAVQRPRELSNIKKKLLEEARMAGESFYYGWGGGKERIEGASIDCALAAARCFGNCAVENLPIQETPDAWVMGASFIDLETGFTMSRQFRQSKTSIVHGKHDPERKADMRFQIGQSKAIRNVILKGGIPSWLIDQAVAEAKAGVRATIENYVKQKGLPAAIDLIIKELGKVGVKEDRILGKVGASKREAIDLDDLVMLRGDLSALQSGKEYADTLFPEPETKRAQTSNALDGIDDPSPDDAHFSPGTGNQDAEPPALTLDDLTADIAACQYREDLSPLETKYRGPDSTLSEVDLDVAGRMIGEWASKLPSKARSAKQTQKHITD